MYCEKKEKRSLIDLFKVYDCLACKYYLDDEVIKIGYNYIKVYYLKKDCLMEKERFIYGKSNRVNLIFKDICINQLFSYNNIVLWMNRDDDFRNYYSDFSGFLNKGYNIIIII